MALSRRRFLANTALAAAAAGARGWSAPPPRKFTATGKEFQLDGRPYVLRSGSMHYPRVPRPYWRDRMRKLRALGLNTLCTYVFWNAHEPRPGSFDFRDNLDVAAYVHTAQQEGLHVILRPGPYVCSEWDFGGFPAWLLASGEIHVRGRDPRFLAAAGRYLRRLGRELAPLQITRGGPIVLVQVENEYGSFIGTGPSAAAPRDPLPLAPARGPQGPKPGLRATGADHVYMAAIRDLITGAGFEVPLFTADGPSPRLLAAGALPPLPHAINFGDTDSPQEAFATLETFRQQTGASGPPFCAEYWVGWFDHWGERHHTTPPEHATSGVDWMLAQGISCNLYMAHGGTSFGFWSGANYARSYQPDTTSYGYDAPLDEAGRPTPKFTALRQVYTCHLVSGESLPELPAPIPVTEVPIFELTEWAPLSQLFLNHRAAPEPLCMEELGQSFGLVWYRTQVPATSSATIEVDAVRDYARFYQGDTLLGEWDRSRHPDSQSATVTAPLRAAAPLDILVEAMGRVNFGPHLQDNRQGITGRVRLNGTDLDGWSIASLPMDNLDRLRFSSLPGDATPAGPGFYRGHLRLDRPADTFLDLRGWTKGFVWVNGHNLGRFWNRGPQQSLYLPGCWLRAGANEVIVFDWEPPAARPRLQGSRDPIFATAASAPDRI